MYEIRWDHGARDDMKRLRLRAFEARQIVDTVDGQLAYEPDRESKRKKMIRPGESLPFEHLEPVWELRVGEYRVFYESPSTNRMRRDRNGEATREWSAFAPFATSRHTRRQRTFYETHRSERGEDEPERFR